MYENKVVVERYNKKSLDLLQFHEIDEKLDKIEVEQDDRDSSSRVERLDNISAQVIGLLLYTEKRCRKLRIGEVNFSLEVSKATKTQYLQRIVLKVAQGRSQCKRELAQILYEVNAEVGDLTNIQVIKSNIVRSRTEYLNNCVAQEKQRKNYLELEN